MVCCDVDTDNEVATRDNEDSQVDIVRRKKKQKNKIPGS